MPTILEFQIRPKESDAFTLEIFERGRNLPLAHAAFDYPLSYMTEYEIGQLDFDAKDPQARLERLRAFGGKLYEKLFSADVQKVWQSYKTKSDFLILCLRVAPEASGLEALPWETLFDGEEFLAAGAKTGLSRLPLDIPPQDDLPPIPPPLKMLAFISSPLDLAETERLQMEREQELLLQAVNAPAGQGVLQVDFEDEAKLPILESSLEAGYHIFHYSGHGIPPKDGGGLLLENAAGKRRPTPAAEILQAMQKAEATLRLTVISGCQTARTLHSGGFRDLARGLAQRRVPAVLAMQFSISDVGGLRLAETLFPRLATGQPLEMAMSATRRTLLQSDDPYLQGDALAPVLITSNGACLRLGEATAARSTAAPAIDFSFYLPLPQLSFGFYGRRREYRQIRDALVQHNRRAVIVHGMGGIGKTALISNVATRLRKQFRGIYAFDCTRGGLAPETIVLELHRYFERQGVTALLPLLHQSIPPEQLANFLAQVLSQWPLLLIFDNFESQLTTDHGQLTTDHGSRDTHFIADSNLRVFLTTLIKATATGSRFLFTCRYRFDLDEKRLADLQELPLGELSRPEALGLMQKLPHLSAAGFEEKQAAFKTFGGHPYALVTLDRHGSHRPLAKILEDARGVHAELREFLAIELNYAHLSERTRELLNRLAAFRSPVPTEAAEWVMGETVDTATDFLKRLDRKKLQDEYKAMSDAELLAMLKETLPEKRQAKDVHQPISELVSWGLLTPLSEEGNLKTLAVHNLVRDFCREKIGNETWRLHLQDAAAFYTNQTKLLEQDEKSPAAVWSEMEAFELLMEAEEFERAANLLLNADPLLARWGLGRYLESQYRRVLDKVDRDLMARMTHNLGILLQDRGEYGAALKHYEQSLKIKEELGNRAGVAKSLHQIGRIHELRGDYGTALQHYNQSLKIEEELGDRDGVAKSLHQIGRIHELRGDYGTALQHYEQSLKIKEEIGDRAGVAVSLHQIGMIHQARGDYGAALQHYQQSLKTLEEIGDRAGVAWSHGALGQLFTQIKRYPEAFQHSLVALSICRELQSPNVQLALKDLKNLRAQWGAKEFDAAWQQATGAAVPEEFKNPPLSPLEKEG